MTSLLAQAFRSRWASFWCLLVVLTAVVLPPGGFGVPMCQFKQATKLPCFGCGMTRSFVAMAHLRLGAAAFFHPVGVVLFPGVLLVALLLPLSPEVRERLATWTEAHREVVNRGGWALLVLFLTYGTGRMVWLIASHQPSPW